MILTFSNELGSIDFHGGGGKNFNIISISGMSFVEKRYTTVKYYGVDGQTTVDSSDMPRVITIGGDMLYSRTLAEQAVKVLSRECTLTFSESGKKRKVTCKPIAFNLCDKIGKFRKFQLQVECDKPYFTDEEETKIYLHRRTNLVTGDLFLPCVFTERIYDKSAVNGGVENVYPVIAAEATLLSGIEGETYIKIVNETTGASLLINCDIGEGEKIEIDLENRKIRGSIQGNLLNCLAEGYLSDFYLVPGENVITFENHTSRLGDAVVCYYNKYRECVF